jgi:hypothetical protein
MIYARSVVERRARSDSTLHVLTSSSVPVQILRSAELSLSDGELVAGFCGMEIGELQEKPHRSDLSSTLFVII